MKYIVTGAAGHLGVNLVGKLMLKKDAIVKAVLLPGENAVFEGAENVEIVRGDVTDRKFLESVIEKDSTVIHLAGIIDICAGNKDRVYQVNVEGTKNVAEVSLEKGVARFVYTSSVHVIPPRNGVKMTEPISFDPDGIVGDYAKSKTLATKAVFDAIGRGLNGVVVYPSGIIGPEDYRVSEMGELFVEIVNRKIKISLKGGYDFADVRDVADGILAAAEKGKAGEGYILSGESVTVDRIYAAVRQVTREKKHAPKIAMWFVRLFAFPLELFARICGKKPLFTKYSLYTISAPHEFSHEKATKELNYSPRPPEESIRDAIRWFYLNKPELFNEKALVRLKKAFGSSSVRKPVMTKKAYKSQ